MIISEYFKITNEKITLNVIIGHFNVLSDHDHFKSMKSDYLWLITLKCKWSFYGYKQLL